MQASAKNPRNHQTSSGSKYQKSSQSDQLSSASPALIRNAMIINLALLGLIMGSYYYDGLFIKDILAATVIILIVAAIKLNESKNKK